MNPAKKRKGPPPSNQTNHHTTDFSTDTINQHKKQKTTHAPPIQSQPITSHTPATSDALSKSTQPHAAYTCRILSSTSIRSKVTRLVSELQRHPFAHIQLSALPNTASKLISITEITKRVFTAAVTPDTITPTVITSTSHAGAKSKQQSKSQPQSVPDRPVLWQYTCIAGGEGVQVVKRARSSLVEPGRRKGDLVDVEGEEEGEEEEAEDAFEVTRLVGEALDLVEPRVKVHETPVLRICLSRVPLAPPDLGNLEWDIGRRGGGSHDSGGKAWGIQLVYA